MPRPQDQVFSNSTAGRGRPILTRRMGSADALRGRWSTGDRQQSRGTSVASRSISQGTEDKSKQKFEVLGKRLPSLRRVSLN
jgi:hypothetical protein